MERFMQTLPASVLVAPVGIEPTSSRSKRGILSVERKGFMVAGVRFELTHLSARAYETPENDRFSNPHYGRPSRT